MKKLILGTCALVALAAVSCGKCNDDACKASATSDSLSMAYGNYVGTVLGMDFERRADGSAVNTEEATAKRNDFLKGMQLVFAANASEDELTGIQVANQMLAEINQFKSQSIELDRAKVFESFKKAFLADSNNTFTAQKGYETMQRLMNEARAEAIARAEAEQAEAPDAVENVKAGKEYVEAQKAEGADIQETESGLYYTIVEEGTGDKPGETSTVVVNYTGTHLNGEVFDSTDGREPATFNLAGVVPGFREGLMLLGKGGKAVLYIPGELAYGVNGQAGAGIGPNEMLVFNVELLEVDPE